MRGGTSETGWVGGVTERLKGIERKESRRRRRLEKGRTLREGDLSTYGVRSEGSREIEFSEDYVRNWWHGFFVFSKREVLEIGERDDNKRGFVNSESL